MLQGLQCTSSSALALTPQYLRFPALNALVWLHEEITRHQTAESLVTGTYANTLFVLSTGDATTPEFTALSNAVYAWEDELTRVVQQCDLTEESGFVPVPGHLSPREQQLWVPKFPLQNQNLFRSLRDGVRLYFVLSLLGYAILQPLIRIVNPDSWRMSLAAYGIQLTRKVGISQIGSGLHVNI